MPRNIQIPIGYTIGCLVVVPIFGTAFSWGMLTAAVTILVLFLILGD